MIGGEFVYEYPEVAGQWLRWYRFPLRDYARDLYLIAPHRPWRAHLWRMVSLYAFWRPVLRLGLIWPNEGEYIRYGRWFADWPWRNSASVWRRGMR